MKNKVLHFLIMVFFFSIMISAAAFSQAGKIPFDFPPQEKINAEKDDFILCPPDNWIKDGFTKGGDKVTFIFYGANMSEPGKYESKVLNLTKRAMTIPNSIIIPIRKGEKVKVGDIILTHWQSGSGMQRAIVVGGSATEPVVRYLDITYENPSGAGKKDDKCKPNTFHKLTKEYEPGTSIAVKDGNKYVHWKVINISGNKILCLGFAGKMDVFDKKNTVAIPIKYIPKEGEKIFVPNKLDSFTQGVVKSLDKKIGRVFVEYEWANKKETVAIPFGQIISKLP